MHFLQMLLFIFIMVKLLSSLLGFLPFFIAKISCSCNNPSPPSFLNPIVKAGLDFNSPLNQYLMLILFECQLSSKIINIQSFPLLYLYLRSSKSKDLQAQIPCLIWQLTDPPLNTRYFLLNKIFFHQQGSSWKC